MKDNVIQTLDMDERPWLLKENEKGVVVLSYAGVPLLADGSEYKNVIMADSTGISIVGALSELIANNYTVNLMLIFSISKVFSPTHKIYEN